jgi:hypothetical protein
VSGEISIRAVLAGMIGPSREQRKALGRGADVVLERHQLETFTHSQMPANLADHATWTLSGDDKLTPAS